MSEKFIFHGPATFIEKPRETVIQNFQNAYISEGNSDADKANQELIKLLELILNSKDLPSEEKEESVQALHDVATQVKEEKGSKLTIKGTLKAVQEIVANAADIAIPAVSMINIVMKILGLS